MALDSSFAGVSYDGLCTIVRVAMRLASTCLPTAPQSRLGVGNRPQHALLNLSPDYSSRRRIVRRGGTGRYMGSQRSSYAPSFESRRVSQGGPIWGRDTALPPLRGVSAPSRPHIGNLILPKGESEIVCGHLCTTLHSSFVGVSEAVQRTDRGQALGLVLWRTPGHSAPHNEHLRVLLLLCALSSLDLKSV